MSLILAIEPDHRQAAQLADLIRGRLKADLVHAHTTEGALIALAGIGDRVPDLVLVPSLLSAQEDTAIAGALRVIAAAANVRMLTIPMLADPEQPTQHRGVFAKLRGRKAQTTPGGCDPAVFAEQIASYLAEAAAERRAAQEADADLVAPAAMAVAPPGEAVVATPPVSETRLAAAPVVEEIRAPIEPVLETPAETVSIRFKPLVIGPAPRPATTFGQHVSVVRNPPVAPADTPLVLSESFGAKRPVEEPRSIWQGTPVKPPVEDESAHRDALAEAVFVDETPEPIETPVDVVAIAAQQPLPVEPGPASEETPVEQELALAANAEDASQVLAIEEVLQALAREETPPVVATHETAQAAPVEDAPVVVAIPEEPAGPESATVAEAIPEPARLSRRRRKALRAAAAESDDRFDIDALLAPLLSEIAAKRAVPAKTEPSHVAAATEPTRADAAPIEVSATPVASVETPEPVAIPEVATAPVVHAEPVDQPPFEQLAAAFTPVEPTAIAPTAIEPTPIELTAIAPPSVELTTTELTGTESTQIEAALDNPAPNDPTPIYPTPNYPTLIEPTPIAPTPVQASWVESTPVAPAPVAPAPIELAPAALIVGDSAPVARDGAAEIDVDPMFFADDVHDGVTDPAPHDRPAWVELIESLRKDIERLKAERTQPAEAVPAATVAVPVSEPQPPRIGRVLSIAAARPASPAPPPPAAKLSTVVPRSKAPKPVQDQWGLFDPEQCGFAALRAKLDEISAREEVSV